MSKRLNKGAGGSEAFGSNGKPRSQNDVPADKTAWWQPAVNLFLKISGWIAVPVIMATFLGNWLDEKFGTKPWLFLATVFVAFTSSMIAIIRFTMKEYKKIEDDSKKKNKESEIFPK
jgi:F0F1-type ATP synthase assembly protein I